jgi:hypothetical protein
VSYRTKLGPRPRRMTREERREKLHEAAEAGRREMQAKRDHRYDRSMSHLGRGASSAQGYSGS